MADYFGSRALASAATRQPQAKRKEYVAEAAALACHTQVKQTRITSSAPAMPSRASTYLQATARHEQLLRNNEISQALGCNSGTNTHLSSCSPALPCNSKPMCMKENNLFPKCDEQKYFFGYH